MRIIKNTCIEEIIVKCPNCSSIFAYEYKDIECSWSIKSIVCPCCHSKDAIWNYNKLNEGEI